MSHMKVTRLFLTRHGQTVTNTEALLGHWKLT
jgi:broad specificity phosphatase PhoE